VKQNTKTQIDYTTYEGAYGQLKPGYNVNVATANGFIVGYYISADRNDVQTLIPFMKKLREAYPKHHPGRVVVDSGYESEEIYCWFEELKDCELSNRRAA
jgi:hypothetical protein